MKKDILHNIKSSGHKIPDQYFETFDDNLFERLSEIDAIGNIEATGYKVPEDYFKNVESQILQNIQTKEQPIVKMVPKKTFYYIAAIAASLVLFFSLFYNTNNDLSFDTIDTVAIENYLYQEEYSYDDLATLIQTSEISETDFINVKISEETLDQYLDAIDTEDLILE